MYLQALNLAVNGKVVDHIAPSFMKTDSFLKEWNLGLKDQRDLFLAMSNVARENKRYDIHELLQMVGASEWHWLFLHIGYLN